MGSILQSLIGGGHPAAAQASASAGPILPQAAQEMGSAGPIDSGLKVPVSATPSVPLNAQTLSAMPVDMPSNVPANAPIDVVGRSATGFQPKPESFLGKIGDVLLMLDGQKPIFHDRTVAANQRAALQDFYNHPDESQRLLMSRLESIPGADPNFAPTTAEGMARADYMKQYGQMRQDESHNNGFKLLSGALSAIQRNPNAEQVYMNALPQLQNIANKYDLGDVLPDKYDADRIDALANSGISGYDQSRLKQAATNEEDLEGYRNFEKGARQTELGIQEQGVNLRKIEVGSSLARTQSEIEKNDSDITKNTQGTLFQRQNYYKKVLGGASNVPWLYNGFVKGVYGGGSSGSPVPGTAYVSPDKTAAVRMDANGQWEVYDLRGAKLKGGSQFYGAKKVGVLGGGATPAGDASADDGSGDFK